MSNAQVAFEELKKAIRVAGSQGKLAIAINKSLPRGTIKVIQARVSNWVRRDRKMGAQYCSAADKALRGVVKKEKLRPDIFY